MGNISTIKEVLIEQSNKEFIDNYSEYFERLEYALKDLIKLHVELALKKASKKAKLKDEGRYVLGDEDWHEKLVIDKESILNSYPLDNIK